jgi:hypothetical protein
MSASPRAQNEQINDIYEQLNTRTRCCQGALRRQLKNSAVKDTDSLVNLIRLLAKPQSIFGKRFQDTQLLRIFMQGVIESNDPTLFALVQKAYLLAAMDWTAEHLGRRCNRKHKKYEQLTATRRCYADRIAGDGNDLAGRFLSAAASMFRTGRSRCQSNASAKSGKDFRYAQDIFAGYQKQWAAHLAAAR